MESILSENIKNILATRRTIGWIAHNFKITDQTYIKNKELFIKKNLKKSILESPLAWKTQDLVYYIALDLYQYVIVKISGKSADLLDLDISNKEDSNKTVVDLMIEEHNKLQSNLV